MTALPVIIRELREEARRPFNYWLRVLGAAALVGIFTMMVWGRQWGPTTSGAELFGNLNAALFAAIWILVPLLTADCISAEKREGTLGLLFLTPLTARGIVAGKSIIHALRALTLLLAAMPVVAVTFVLGGVSRLDILTAVGFDLAAVALALAAGLLASAWAKEWVRAVMLAEILSLIFAWSFSMAVIASHRSLNFTPAPPVIVASGPGTMVTRYVVVNGQTVQQNVFVPTYGNQGFVPLNSYPSRRVNLLTETISAPSLAGAPPAVYRNWSLIVAGLFSASLLVLILAASLAARRVDRSWQEESLSKRQLWLLRTFCTPLFWQSFFHKEMSRVLDKNPISWLQQYSWSARLTKWGWCLIIVFLDGLLSSGSNPWQRFSEWQPRLCFLLLLGLAFSSAGSFRREKQSGALELLLVAPLTEEQIVSGRLWGIWKQFFPACLVLSLFWSQLGVFVNRRQGPVDYSIFLGTAFLTVPVIGLYFSLRLQNFFSAWLWTGLVGIGTPYFWTVFTSRLLSQYPPPGITSRAEDYATFLSFMTIGCQAAVVIVFAALLLMNLRDRKFAFA